VTTAEIALLVALAAGAGLVLAVAAGHWLGRPQGATGLGLALLGVLLIGFPLFETFELGVGADGGATLKAELKSDVAATEAELVARLDALGERVEALTEPPDAVLAPPDPEAGLGMPAPGPAPEPAPQAAGPRDATALVFHRAARRDDAATLVEALRDEGFAASAIATDLVEAADLPSGAARILWQDGRRDAAEAVGRVAGTVLAQPPRLDADPSDLYRGDVQVQMF